MPTTEEWVARTTAAILRMLSDPNYKSNKDDQRLVKLYKSEIRQTLSPPSYSKWLKANRLYKESVLK
jgi:hypothetical protein